MTSTISIFKKIFWDKKICRNLFLLSKTELLDTKEIRYEGSVSYVSFPRIILSNIDKNDSHELEKINIRSEGNALFNESFINQAVDHYQPMLTKFLEDKLGNSLNKLVEDINKRPFNLVKKAVKIILDDKENLESSVIDFLKTYDFIPKHLSTFSALEEYFHKETIHKRFKEILSEENVFNLIEFFQSLKEIHNHYTYKSLYNSNQILVNALHCEDNFESRIKLFDLLYEAYILKPSTNDSFVECTVCENETYKGNLIIRINPGKLKNLICPVCQNALSYYVPYDLNDELFTIINSKDGIILNLCEWLLIDKKIIPKFNVFFQPDMEIDCIFEYGNIHYLVETKMYKMSNAENRLLIKIKSHLNKLCTDVKSIKEIPENININDSVEVCHNVSWLCSY